MDKKTLLAVIDLLQQEDPNNTNTARRIINTKLMQIEDEERRDLEFFKDCHRLWIKYCGTEYEQFLDSKLMKGKQCLY